MPDMTLLGWFHTIFGVLALVTAFYTLRHYKVISMQHLPGKAICLHHYFCRRVVFSDLQSGRVRYSALVGGANASGSFWWSCHGKIQAVWWLLQVLSGLGLHQYAFIPYDTCNY